MILPLVFILSVTAVFFGSTLVPPDGFILYGGDLSEQFFFWKSFLVQNITHGIIPFWNPYSFSGTPFLAHPSIAPFYPLTIIFFLFPINSAFSIYLYIHLSLGAIFMYHLVSKGDKLAGLAAAVVFALSGMTAARIYSGHIDIISTLIWIPAVFGSSTDALKNPGRKKITLAIVFLTLQILAGYQAVVVFTLELIFIYQLVITIDRHAPLAMTRGVKSFLTLLFIIVTAFGISAIQLLPTIEFVKNSIRGDGLPYNLLTWGSYTADQFLMFISPFRYGNPFPSNYTYNGPGPNFFEVSFYAGTLPILLFIVYFIYKTYELIFKKRIDKVFLGLSAGLSFFILVSLGNNFLLHPLLYKLIPFYRLFRFPSQHLIVAVFIISIFVGFLLRTIKLKPLKLVILLFIIGELLLYDRKFIRLAKVPTASFDHNLISILQKEKELVRVLPMFTVVSPVRKSWDFESSMLYRIPSTSGYNPILLNAYYHFIDLANKNYTSSITQYNVEIPPPDPASKEIDFLNVKYVLADKNYDIIKDKFLSKYILKTEGPTYRLYENKDYSPRFFTKCKEGDFQKAEVSDYRLNNIKLKTNSNCGGILSSSEIYYPGWKAVVDGREVQIEKSSMPFRSVLLPIGEHEVDFYYEPTIYLIGGLISLTSLIIALIVIASEAWRSR